MLERLTTIAQVAGIAELIVAAGGFIIVGGVAVWRKVSSSPPPSLQEIANEAERYKQLYGEAAVRRLGAEMHQERVARGIGPRYRFLSEISECLSNAQHMSGTTAGAAAPAFRNQAESITSELPVRRWRTERARRHQLTVETAVARKQAEDNNLFHFTRISEHKRPAVNAKLLDPADMRKLDV